jgi:hypothetical protein
VLDCASSRASASCLCTSDESEAATLCVVSRKSVSMRASTSSRASRMHAASARHSAARLSCALHEEEEAAVVSCARNKARRKRSAESAL